MSETESNEKAGYPPLYAEESCIQNSAIAKRRIQNPVPGSGAKSNLGCLSNRSDPEATGVVSPGGYGLPHHS